MGRLRLAPWIPQSHGRLSRPSRHDRMRPPPARAHRPLRAPAGRRHSRPPHVLRDGLYARRIRQPAARRKPSRPSHKSRRQRPTPGLARWHRHLCASLAPRPLRSRPLPDRYVDGRRPLVASLPRRDPRPAQRAESTARRGHSHSDADDFFADARRPTAQLPEDLSAGQVARLRAGESRQRPRRRQARLRTARRNALRLLEGRRRRLARRRLPLRRIPRQHALHPRLRQAPQSGRADESPVCNREHTEFNGSEGGPSAAHVGVQS